MKVATGTIVEGKVVIEGNAFPEGTVVAVIARGEEAMVTLPAWLQAELDAAIEDADTDTDTGVSAEEFLARLKRFG